MASLASVVAGVMDILDDPFNNMLKGRTEDVVIGVRAVLIRQEYTKTRQFPSWSLYDALIPIQEDSCNCGQWTIVGDMPDLIQLKEQSPFSFVGTDGYKAISYIMPEEIEFYQYNPISGKMPRYTYINKTTKFLNVGNLDAILHRGPFADPRQLKKYSCDGEICFNDEDDNFIEEHLRPVITEMALKELGVKQTDDHEVQSNNL